MSDTLNISDFLDPLNPAVISNDEGYSDGQVGKVIEIYEDDFPDIMKADIILIGCAESRGRKVRQDSLHAPNEIRAAFYKMYYWHSDIKVVDIGNVRLGAALDDTYAALKVVIEELTKAGKFVLILGGSHDLTLAQYNAFAGQGKVIEATCVDALIDLNLETHFRSSNFLMEMLTGHPNFIRHYNHIGFQSYFVHPLMLETMDKLRFDCFRLGYVKENPEEMEPVIRNSDLFSFDISAIAHAYAPAHTVSPNGLNGEEACMLMRYAGQSHSLTTAGIYGYEAGKDKDGLTAKQIGQMIWYFIDGKNRGGREALLREKDAFNVFHTVFAEVETTFMQSKKTGRWWMQLPDQRYIACSYNDYILARSNEIPERWLRAQERS